MSASNNRNNLVSEEEELTIIEEEVPQRSSSLPPQTLIVVPNNHLQATQNVLTQIEPITDEIVLTRTNNSISTINSLSDGVIPSSSTGGQPVTSIVIGTNGPMQTLNIGNTLISHGGSNNIGPKMSLAQKLISYTRLMSTMTRKNIVHDDYGIIIEKFDRFVKDTLPPKDFKDAYEQIKILRSSKLSKSRNNTKEIDHETLESLKDLFLDSEFYSYQKTTNEAVRSMISCFSVLFLMTTCVSYAIFFTMLNRLLTDSNLMIINNGYVANPPSDSCQRFEQYNSSVLVGLTEFVRNYIVAIAVPLAITWFGDFNSQVRYQAYDYFMDMFSFSLLILSFGISCIVAVASVVIQFSWHIAVYTDCSSNAQDKLNVVLTVFVLALAQVFIWVLSYICYYSMTFHKRYGKLIRDAISTIIDKVFWDEDESKDRNVSEFVRTFNQIHKIDRNPLYLQNDPYYLQQTHNVVRKRPNASNPRTIRTNVLNQ